MLLDIPSIQALTVILSALPIPIGLALALLGVLA